MSGARSSGGLSIAVHLHRALLSLASAALILGWGPPPALAPSCAPAAMRLSDAGPRIDMPAPALSAVSHESTLPPVVDSNGKIGRALSGHGARGNIPVETTTQLKGNRGYGVAAVDDAGSGGASLTVRQSVVSTNSASNVVVLGWSAAVESTAARDLGADPQAMFERGIDVALGVYLPDAPIDRDRDRYLGGDATADDLGHSLCPSRLSRSRYTSPQLSQPGDTFRRRVS